MRKLAAVTTVALAVMLAAGVSSAQEPAIYLRLQTATIQPHKSIIFHSDVGQANTPILEYFHRTWQAIKRRIDGQHSAPPEPIRIYFLNEGHFRLVDYCGQSCRGGGVPVGSRGIALYTNNWASEVSLGFGSYNLSNGVAHELLHVGAFWVLVENQQFSDSDPLWRSPQLASLVRLAISQLNYELGPEPDPSVLDADSYQRLLSGRYQRLISIVKRIIGWGAYLEAAVRPPDFERAKERWGYLVRFASAEEVMATGLFRLYVGAFNEHVDGTDLFRRAVWSITAEVDAECAADGGCPDFRTAERYLSCANPTLFGCVR